jgi:hypothetical protein
LRLSPLGEEFKDLVQHPFCGLHLIVRGSNARTAPMVAYSIDVRQKILHAYERRLGSQCAIADLFGVSSGSFVEKLLRRYRTVGDIAPKPRQRVPATCGP